MHIFTNRLDKYLPEIIKIPNKSIFQEEDLCISTFLLVKDKNLEIYYTPFDYVKSDAKIILTGITPGWTQMELAFRTAKQGLLRGRFGTELFLEIDKSASFAGSMRTNLVNMLDIIGIPDNLGITSSSQLFSSKVDLAHTNSLIRYPVFVNGKNYTGHSPNILKNLTLMSFVEETFLDEVNRLKNALIVPLGKSVEAVLEHFAAKGFIENDRILWGFPHPSGGNGHRAKQFETNKEAMRRKVSDWFKKSDI